MLRNNAMLADAHISSLGYLWCKQLLLSLRCSVGVGSRLSSS